MCLYHKFMSKHQRQKQCLEKKTNTKTHNRSTSDGDYLKIDASNDGELEVTEVSSHDEGVVGNTSNKTNASGETKEEKPSSSTPPPSTLPQALPAGGQRKLCAHPNARVAAPCEPLPGREGLPSRNIQLVESPDTWMKEMKEMDGLRRGVPPHLWRVGDKLYDLCGFVGRHPGGAQWIAATQGFDITELYETHHLDGAKVAQVLGKYYVQPADTSAPPRFTFNHDGLYKVLQRRVFAALGNKIANTNATRETLGVSIAGLALFLGSFGVMCRSGSGCVAYTFAVVAGAFIHMLLGIGHNYFHQADHPLRFAFDLSCFSSYDWRHTHAISHHIFTNLELDTEVSSLEPLLYFLSNKPKNSPIVILSYPLLLFFAGILDFVARHVTFARGHTPWRQETAIVYVEVAMLVWCQGCCRGLGLFVVMQGVASFLLASISFAVHRSEYAWTEGDKNAQLDYAMHILMTTNDHSMEYSLFSSMLLYAGLNVHTLHHLFPTVDRSRFPIIIPIFKQTCKEFGVEHKSYSFLELWVGTLQRHNFPFLSTAETSKAK